VLTIQISLVQAGNSATNAYSSNFKMLVQTQQLQITQISLVKMLVIVQQLQIIQISLVEKLVKQVLSTQISWVKMLVEMQ
jgi:hypothetical protein